MKINILFVNSLFYLNTKGIFPLLSFKYKKAKNVYQKIFDNTFFPVENFINKLV